MYVFIDFFILFTCTFNACIQFVFLLLLYVYNIYSCIIVWMFFLNKLIFYYYKATRFSGQNTLPTSMSHRSVE